MFIKFEIDLPNSWYNFSTGPNFVLNRDYELRKEDKDSYTYPVDGWYWVDTTEDLVALPPVQTLLSEGLIDQEKISEIPLL